MIPQIRKYFVITVHFGPPNTTDKLLHSLAGNTELPDKVIVVDHALEPYKPPVVSMNIQTIRPERNEGYAAGINLAFGTLLSQSTGADDIVICLNNDVVVEKDTIKNIKEWWQAHSAPVLAGSTAGILNLLTGRSVLTSHMPSHVPWWQSVYMHGACMIAPLKICLDAKALPESFFLYWEDVAFSRAIQKLGYKLMIIPGITLSHPDARQVGSDQLFYLVRNGAWYLEHKLNFLGRVYWYLVNRLRYVYHSARGHKQIKAALRAAREGKLQKI
jgi:GT2 family glycosyltransferase